MEVLFVAFTYNISSPPATAALKTGDTITRNSEPEQRLKIIFYFKAFGVILSPIENLLESIPFL